ncbi:MAG: ribosomal protein S18-alanine N-acetyltransferase [Natronomonas sp.]
MVRKREITLREARRADLLSVFRIEKQSFPQPWSYTAFERFLGNPGFVVAEHNKTVVGYVVGDSIRNHGTPLGHVKDLAVRSDYRGNGIGRLLFGRAVEVLRSQGVDRVKLEVRTTNETALGLYRDFGFHVDHIVSGYYNDGDDAYVMYKRLDR